MNCPKCRFENPSDTRFCGNCAAPLIQAEDVPPDGTETLEIPFLELKIGSALAGRYKIIEILGAGGMGRLYKAFDKEIREIVALKLIKPEIIAQGKAIERFKNEVRLARKISHKNVCRMYEFGNEGGVYYITMEFVPGEDLKHSIKRMGPLTVGKTLFIAGQICQGLAEAHKIGVIHRDLKPRNIMIDAEGNVRIMDFGLAKSVEAKEITDANVVIGSPYYMSPEQVGGKKLDLRSDFYSLGVTLYEMVTGSRPFEGGTSLTIAVKHQTEVPRDPKELNPEIPEALNLLILKCLEKEKENRYQSVEQIASELGAMEEEISSSERVVSRKKLRRELRPRMTHLKFSKTAWILFFMALVLTAGYLFYDRVLKDRKTGPGFSMEKLYKTSIAVLTFEDLSVQRDQAHLCEGLTEEIIVRLSSSCPELRVLPWIHMRSYESLGKSPREMGVELDVENILAPTLKYEGDTIRVTAQLIDSISGNVLHNFQSSIKFERVSSVADKLSETIASDLKLKLLSGKLKAEKEREPENTEAYEYYMWGRYFEGKYFESHQQENFDKGFKNFRLAIQSDPGYAKAYWGLGNLFESRYVWLDDDKDLEQMFDNYSRAYKIDPDLAQANVGLGWSYFFRGNNDRAFRYFKKAVELDPFNTAVNSNVGHFFRSIGLFQKAIKYYSKVLEVNPLDKDYRPYLVICLRYLGSYDEAIVHAQKLLESDPENKVFILSLVRLFALKKELDIAEFQLAPVEERSPEDSLVTNVRALILASRGEKEKSLLLIKDVSLVYSTYLISPIYSLLNMTDEAIQNIKEGISWGFSGVHEYLYSYPILENNSCYDNLRDDPRFQEILKKEKEKYEKKLNKYKDL